MNTLGSPLSQRVRLVCVVPQPWGFGLGLPIDLPEATAVRGLRSRRQRLRRVLGFAVSDPIQTRVAAPGEARTATTDYNSWIPNLPPIRETSLDEWVVDQQARDSDLDGSPVRVAPSQEL